MEKRTKKQLILMSLKRIKGFGNKKIISLINNNSLKLTHKKLKETSQDYRIFLKEEEKILNYCYKNNIGIISYFDKEYPNKLKKINSPPIILFYKGNIQLLNKRGISVVGSRKSSLKALEWTNNICKDLIEKEYVIISGGAKGIDFIAHNSALNNKGHTICVLGCGLNNIYPKENKQLIEKIEKEGLILTEYSPNKKVNRFSLLERNRITSGLGEKLLIIASNADGGSMSQFKVGVLQKKEIFVPDLSLSLEPNEGIKEIIKNKQGLPILNSKDIFKTNYKINNSQTILISIYFTY